jgi:hypothetical protein
MLTQRAHKPLGYVQKITHLYDKYWNVLLALFFLWVEGLVLLALLPNPDTQKLIFWYCNNVAVLYVYAYYTKRLDLVKAFNYVAVIAQLLWMTDFFSHLLGYDVSRTANYVFTEGFTFANSVSILVHISYPVVVLLSTMHVKPTLAPVKYSFVYIAVLYAIALLLGRPDSNADDVNCVFTACVPQAAFFHVYFWPFYMVLLLALGYLLHVVLYRVYTFIYKQ